MSWTKAKNIIILILLSANLLLLVLAIPIYRRQQNQAQQIGQELEQLFAGQGVSFDASILPEEKTLYGLELSHGTDAAATAVTALLGDSVLVQTDSGRYLSVYTGPNGSCTFSQSGSFTAELTLSPAGTGSLLADADSVLAAMGFDAAETVLAGQDDAGRDLVQAFQSLLGVPVFGSGLTLTYDGDSLVSVTGTFFACDDSPVRVSDETCISAADALVIFLSGRDTFGWVGSEVTSVEQGWLETETPSASVVRLTPIWRITTDTAVFHVDGLDGTLRVFA